MEEVLADADPFYLGEVEVRARRVPVMEEAGATTVMTAAQLEAHGDRTIAQALERVPGMSVYTHTKGQSRVRLRGFDQAYLVVLIDGVPIDDIYSTDIDLSNIPLALVERIVIERGVSSALYGSDGTAGVINIVTRRPGHLLAEVKTELGSNNNNIYSAIVGASRGDFHFLLSGLLMHSDGFEPSKRLNAKTRRAWFDRFIRYELYPVDGPFGSGPMNTFEDVATPAKTQYIEDKGLWDHQDFSKVQLAAKAGYAVSPHLDVNCSASLLVHRGRTSTYEPMAFSSYRGNAWRPNWPYFGDDPEETKKFALRNRAFVWPLVYEARIAPVISARQKNASLVLAPFYLEKKTTQEGYASADHVFMKGESMLLAGRGVPEPYYDLKKLRVLGGRAIGTLRPSSWHKIAVSLMVRHDAYLGAEQAIDPRTSPSTYELRGSEPYRAEDLAAWTLSAGIEDEVTLWKRLRLSVGISYDSLSFYRFRSRTGLEYADRYIASDDSLFLGTNDSLNPVAGAIYTAVPGRLNVHASGAIKTRFPSLGDYAKIVNAEQDQGLGPERAYHANGGLTALFFHESLSLRADVFTSSVFNKIVKLAKEEPPVNADRQTAQGIEGLATLTLGRFDKLVSFVASAGYTYVNVRNEDYSDNETVNKGRRVEYTPAHHLTADIAFDWSFGTSMGIWCTALVHQVAYAMNRRPENIDTPYDTSYFSAQRLHDPFYVNVRATQRFWEDYELSFTVKNLLDDYGMDPFNPGAGRTFYLSLTGKWGTP
jgi:outer membrane receptor protein involved in Fe transport